MELGAVPVSTPMLGTYTCSSTKAWSRRREDCGFT
jgi:hypothetical protein